MSADALPFASPLRPRLSRVRSLTTRRATLQDQPIKEPADDAAEGEPRRKRRKPIGWSMITIAVLVAVSAVLVWRRDGIDGVLDILMHDVDAVRRHPAARVCRLPARRVHCGDPAARQSLALARSESGLKGLLIGAAFGAILPGGPFTAYPVASALLAVGADFGATIAMVVSWTLIGYGRAVAWELPIMGIDFTLWRIVISLPLPILAGALGRFVYVRMYPKGDDE